MFDEYTECAFCNEPIDYCQGHGADQYAVRVQADGVLVSLTLFQSEEEAYDRMDTLTRNPLYAISGTHVDVFDQAGDALASEYVA